MYIHPAGRSIDYLAPACLIRDGAVGRRVKFSITCPTSHDRRPTTSFACFRRETVWNGLPEKLRDHLPEHAKVYPRPHDEPSKGV